MLIFPQNQDQNQVYCHCRGYRRPASVSIHFSRAAVASLISQVERIFCWERRKDLNSLSITKQVSAFFQTDSKDVNEPADIQRNFPSLSLKHVMCIANRTSWLAPSPRFWPGFTAMSASDWLRQQCDFSETNSEIILCANKWPHCWCCCETKPLAAAMGRWHRADSFLCTGAGA